VSATTDGGDRHFAAEVMGVLVSFADFSADAAGHPREGDAWAEHQYCGGTVVVEAVMLGEVALLCDGCGCRFAARRHDGRRERHAALRHRRDHRGRLRRARHDLRPTADRSRIIGPLVSWWSGLM